MAGLTVITTAWADDWPQFCGPDRNNSSKETGLARSWPADGPAVLWKVDVTTGYAGPAIKERKVYLLDHDGTKSSIRSLELDSGKELWTCSFADPGELTNKKFPGTRGTPTVTDDSLYAVTLFGTVVCIDLNSHEIKWQHSLVKDYGKKLGGWGVAQSPLLYGDLVILAPMSARGSLVALDKNSGKEIWKTAEFAGDGFVSPLFVSIGDEDQILMVSGGAKPEKPERRGGDKGSDKPERRDGDKDSEEPKGDVSRLTYVFSVSPKDGKVLWSYEGWSCNNPIPHPISVDHNMLFITSGYKSISTMLKVEKDDSDYNVSELFKTEKAASWIEQPILANNCLFVGGTVKSPSKGLVCLDLEGDVKWDTNLIQGAPVFNHLNMITADDLLIALDGDSGKLYLIEASPKGFNQLASAKVLAEKGQTWGPIALSDGKLLIRDHTVMKCLDLK